MTKNGLIKATFPDVGVVKASTAAPIEGYLGVVQEVGAMKAAELSTKEGSTTFTAYS